MPPQLYNEMYTADRTVRPHYAPFAQWLADTPASRIAQNRHAADLLFHRVGITFAVYGESSGTERLIPFDIVPRIFTALQQARDSVNAATNGFHGQLRIALSDGITPSRLPSLLALCRQEEPEVEIRLFEVPLSQQIKGLHDDLYDGLLEEIEEGVRILLDRGWTPYEVLTKALVEGMRIVGIDFRDGILFVPEVLLAANAMKAGMAILRPLLAETGAERVGTVPSGRARRASVTGAPRTRKIATLPLRSTPLKSSQPRSGAVTP